MLINDRTINSLFIKIKSDTYLRFSNIIAKSDKECIQDLLSKRSHRKFLDFLNLVLHLI